MKKKSFIMELHRYIGLTASLGILLIAVTGFILMHVGDWQWLNGKLSNSMQMWFYNISGKNLVEEFTWERWVMDLHAGRFFGIAEHLINNFIVVALIYLSLSGLYFWFCPRIQKK